MANFGPEIATAQIQLEVELATQQINAAAAAAAAQFNRVFSQTQATLLARSRASQAAAARSIADAFGGIGRNINVATQQLNVFQRAQKLANDLTGRFSSVLTGAAVATAGLTVAVVKLGAGFANTAGNFQELEQSINAIVENSTTANTTTEAFIGSLRSLALQSGRSSEQLANTGRQFLALGFSGEKTVEILDSFARAASLTGASNRQLELALNGVSQIASKGTVSMEELRRQIAENLPGAVNLARFFELLGENMGVTTEEARRLQEQGLVNAEVGIKTLVQTVNEATDGIDVFALRARTLNGLLGILREGFTQAVQDGFRPFVDSITQANSGPLGNFVKGLREGGSVLSGVQGLLARFGQVLGTSFRDILNEIIPLLPGLANLFVTLTEALAPVVVDIVRAASSFAQFLLPALNLAAIGLRTLTTALGPVSFIFRQLLAGGLISGAINSFQLFGRAVGSVGGIIGRIATPVTKFFEAFANTAGSIGAATTAFGFLNPVIKSLGGLSEALRITVIGLGVALVALKLNIVGGAFTKLTTTISPLIVAFKSLSIEILTAARNLTLLRAAQLGIIGVGIVAGVYVFTQALKGADEQAKELINTLREGRDTTTFRGATEAIEELKNKIQEVSDAGNPFEAGGAFNPIKIVESRILVSKLRGELEKLQQAQRDAPGASLFPVDLLTNFSNKIPAVTVDFEKLNEVFKDVVDNQEKLIDAQDKVADAERNLGRANEVVAGAEERLLEARTTLTETTDKLAELEQTRLDLINDTARDIRELTEAEEDLSKIGFRLLDLDREEADILERINKLRTPATAEELAAADRDIERAKIALNKAIAAEQELLNRVNEEQQESLDLTGLTLDQLQTRLAIARASAAAQRANRRDTNAQIVTEEDQLEARLDVLDAQDTLNKLVAERNELDQRVLNNGSQIEELETRLNRLNLDRAALIRDQGAAQAALNLLRSGETSRAEDIRDIDIEIEKIKKQQLQDIKNVIEAENGVKTAVAGVLDANNNVTRAKEAQRNLNIELTGTEAQINQYLRDRIALNDTLIGQSGATQSLLNAQIASIGPALLGAFSGLLGDTGNVLNTIGSPTQNTSSVLADLLLNNPNKLRDLLRALGVEGFAEGGLITRPTFANIGEKFKPEVVLPLTKPDRVWELLSSTLPRFPGALRAAQTAIGPSPAIQKAVRSSGGHRVVPKAEGPMTFGQAQEIIQLLRENGKAEYNIEAPINVTAASSDEDLLAKRISRRVERSILEKMRR